MKFFISSYQHRLLISDSMSTFQTNAGNNILTLSKLHIRAIHHALSEIGTKRWFSYQGIAIKRNYRGQKLLLIVESNRKHGFDLKTFISISNYSSSFWGDIEGIPISPLRHDRSSSMVGALPVSLQDHDRHLSSNFNHTSFNRGNFSFLTDVVEEKEDHSAQCS